MCKIGPEKEAGLLKVVNAALYEQPRQWQTNF